MVEIFLERKNSLNQIQTDGSVCSNEWIEKITMKERVRTVRVMWEKQYNKHATLAGFNDTGSNIKVDVKFTKES